MWRVLSISTCTAIASGARAQGVEAPQALPPPVVESPSSQSFGAEVAFGGGVVDALNAPRIGFGYGLSIDRSVAPQFAIGLRWTNTLAHFALPSGPGRRFFYFAGVLGPDARLQLGSMAWLGAAAGLGYRVDTCITFPILVPLPCTSSGAFGITARAGLAFSSSLQSAAVTLEATAIGPGRTLGCETTGCSSLVTVVVMFGARSF